MSYQQRLATGIAFSANHLGLLDVYSSLRGCLVKSQVAILLYHKAPPHFEEQIRYLTKRYEVLPLDKVVSHISEKKPLPKKAAVITFDDGYKNNYINAYPILYKYKVPATIFLTTGHIGTGDLFWWEKVEYLISNTTLQSLELGKIGVYSLASAGDRSQAASGITAQLKGLTEDRKNFFIEKLVGLSGAAISPALGKEGILSWDEVRDMDRNGITFGAHTVTHPMLTKVSLEQAKYEITQSKRDIESRLGKSVTAFCYPGGDFDTQTVRIVKEAGFRCAVTLVPRMVDFKANLYELGRISSGWNFDSFKLYLSGLYPDIKAILGKA